MKCMEIHEGEKNLEVVHHEDMVLPHLPLITHIQGSVMYISVSI